MVVIPVNAVIHVFCMIAEILTGSAFAYQASRLGGMGITAGCTPSAWTSHMCGSRGYVHMYFTVIFAIVSFFFALVELGLVGRIAYARYFGLGYMRGGIYILKGFACLGVANDLGIGCGIIEIIGGVICIALAVFSSCYSRQQAPK